MRWLPLPWKCAPLPWWSMRGGMLFWRANRGQKAQQMARNKNTADWVPAEIDPTAPLLSSTSPLTHTHTHRECVRGIHIRPKLHGHEMEKPARAMEKQIKRRLRAGFHPRQITSLLWRKKGGRARKGQGKAGPPRSPPVPASIYPAPQVRKIVPFKDMPQSILQVTPHCERFHFCFSHIYSWPQSVFSLHSRNRVVPEIKTHYSRARATKGRAMT